MKDKIVTKTMFWSAGWACKDHSWHYSTTGTDPQWGRCVQHHSGPSGDAPADHPVPGRSPSSVTPPQNPLGPGSIFVKEKGQRYLPSFTRKTQASHKLEPGRLLHL